MTETLFTFPPQAFFGRILPKHKIYEHGNVNNALKALFVQQVEQIVWQYKLAPETINLPAKLGVPEIQIFSITQKSSELNEDILRCIDQAIPFPIIYQLIYSEHIQVKAAYKRPNDADSHKWVVDGYFATGWQAINTERVPLPIVLDLGALYELMLKQLLPVPAKAGENLRTHLERINQIRSKQNECRKIAIQLAKERQFNRKVELNTQLKALQAALRHLQGTA